MFNLVQNASDDQTAIVGCMFTLFAAAFFIFASFHLGPAGKKLRNREQNQLGIKLKNQPPVEHTQKQDRAA